ncbi:MAG: hypothetical protein F6K31_24655 [Symploca sp. SIO2G7]|nr:hypothetical protein [Symploca sp. SIO2G7]
MLEKNLPFIPKVPNLEELAEQLIDKVGVSVTRRFQIFLVEYLAEAYGVRQSQLKPDLECFVNAQANTYAYRGRSELNNICGSVQMSPGRTGKVGGETVTITKVPNCKGVDLSKIRLLFDSCAFTDVLTNSRVSFSKALERQLQTLAKMLGCKETWLVSYDRLIDEKFVDGKRIKQRWSVDEAWEAVRQTVEAARYLSSQRYRLDGYKLVLSCQGVDALQYQQCVEQVLEYATPSDVLGLGGWCILGKQKKWMPVFWEAMRRVIPLIAESGVTQVHIFGVTWFKPHQGYDPPLPGLLRLCDEYGLSLSTDGRLPSAPAKLIAYC